ncbi:MAG: cellulose biosynthesis cyclic di-GMP-binding regulatory protein BcsB [Anaerolineae bacterium]|nr:cellulose biosynthesis cyclic di-GMP-binding regulatory protein BcsB [Anaerolineae bacterium]
MMNKGRIWIALLISIMCLAWSEGWVEAQEPPDDEVQEQEVNEPQNTAGLETYDLTLLDLLYGEQTLDLADLDNTFDIYLPVDVVPAEAGNYINLIFSHNVFDTERQRQLSVSLNDTFLQFINLTTENADRAQAQIDVPGSLLKAGRNRFRVTMNTDLSCGEDITIRPITIIHPESSFHLAYTQPVREPNLGLYPLPFYEQTFLPSQIYFILPNEPTATDFSTAAAVSAGLGIYSQGQARVASVLADEVTETIRRNNHLIIIGQPDTNPLLAELDLPLDLDASVIKDDSGVLEEIVSPWNPSKMVLVVTGRTDEGLLKAGDVLNRDLNFLGMRGPIAVVDEVLPPQPTAVSQEVDLTFDALGYPDITSYGTRPQQVRAEFLMPRSWQMTEEAKLYLSFNHATVINPEQSTLSIELNRVPIGETLLNEQNAINGVLELELPGWLLEPGRNRLDAKIDMTMSEDPCQDLDNQQAWTVVRRDSFVHLPYVEQEAAFDLSFFPFPLTNNPNLMDVTLVLPETLTRLERDRLFQLAVLLGQQAGGDRLTLRAVNSQDIDDTLRKTNHFIAFGRPTNNPFLSEINNDLPQPFQPDSDELVPGLDSANLIETTSRNAGLLQELASPWNSEQTILAITGTSDEGVIAAFDLLLGNLPEEVMATVDLTGDLAVIEDQHIYSTDTRLSTSLSFSQSSTLVEPVVQSGASLRRDLVSRWW